MKHDSVPRYQCHDCLTDVVNNPKCPNYRAVSLKEMGKLEGRTFNANGVFDGVEIENRIDEYEK
jgi:hypothetical protein